MGEGTDSQLGAFSVKSGEEGLSSVSPRQTGWTLRCISEIRRHHCSCFPHGLCGGGTGSCLRCLTPAFFLPWAQEAYAEYLRSIHYISQVLLEEVETTKGTALSFTAALGLGKFWTL